MAQVGTLTVDLIAQTASFNANIAKAAANLNSNAARMNRSVAGLQAGFDKATAAARAFSLIAAGGAFVALAKKSLDFASAIGETAQQIGITTRDLQVYRYIATQTGLAQEEMEAGLRKLTVSLGQAALGARAQGEAFAALGISVRDASGHVKTAGQILPEIADRLEGISDPAQRAAAEVALFGRAGQKLDPVLSRGADNIEAYAKRAEELGLVLSDELVDAADEAADRMAELTTQMKVSFAEVVSANAGAILALANALGTLTAQAINFIAQHPRLVGALSGAALGVRVGGLPGALIGAGGGLVAGNALGRQADDANMDIDFRRRQLGAALETMNRRRQQGQSGGSLFRLHRSNSEGGTIETAVAEVQRQTALLRQATTQATAPSVASLPVAGLPNFLASGGGGGGRRDTGPSAEELAERERRRVESFYDDLARLDSDLLGARMDNLSDNTEMAALARQQVVGEMDRTDASIRAAVIAKDLTQAEADQLLQRTQQLRSEKLLSVNLEEMERNERDMLDVQLAANDNERDLLGALASMATTTAERRDFALALLDLDQQEEQLRLQHIVDMARIGKATAAEAAAAEARLDRLPEIYGVRREAASRANAGPMESYLRDLNDLGRVNEELQNVAVTGLNALNDGLVDALTGVKSLGEAFHDVAQQILADLLRIAIRQTIVKPIANALFGGGVSIPGFAEGTDFAPGGLAWVGERGRELVQLPRGSRVIPHHRLPSMRAPARGANDNFTMNIQVSGAMTERQARETGEQIGRAARRQMNGPLGRH